MYKHNYLYYIIVTFIASSSLVYAVEDDSPTLKSVSDKLVCQCGCNMILSVCNHINCPSAIPMRNEITQKLEAGIPEAEIIADFVKQYGQQVLSAPPAQGFNLNAYIIPFVLLAAGLLILIFTLRRWRRNVEQSPREGEIQPHSSSNADRIEKELDAFD